MRTLIAAALCLLLAGCASLAPAPTVVGPSVPYKTFSELADKAVDTDARLGACSSQAEDGEIILVFFKAPGQGGTYGYSYAQATGIIVFVYWPNEEYAGPPDQIAVSAVAPAKHDEIPLLLWEPYRAEKHGTSPCDALFPEKA